MQLKFLVFLKDMQLDKLLIRVGFFLILSHNLAPKFPYPSTSYPYPAQGFRHTEEFIMP